MERKRRIRGQLTRRDFVNGVLVASGGLALARYLPGCSDDGSPAQAGPPAVPEGLCDGAIGLDPRVLRGGNLPSMFNVGHWLRDRRLSFSASAVSVSALSCDDVSGSLDIQEDGGDQEVIIVGSGISALAASFFLTRQRPGTKILMLDANVAFGGNAGRDDADPALPCLSGNSGAYAVDPYADFLTDFYGTIGIDWESRYIPDPLYNYFFDDKTPHVLPGTRGWNNDTYNTGLASVPYPPEIVADLLAAREDFLAWYDTEGAPTDPADNTDPQFDYLAQMTLAEYLTGTKGFHPAVADFYTRYCIDALASTSEQTNALSAISFLGAEYHPLFSFPGGTSGISRHALKWLIPGSISGTTSDEIITGALATSALDAAGSAVRLRQSAMAVRIDTESDGASVVYWKDGAFHRARAKAVIHAGQGYTGRHLVDHLIDDPTRAAYAKLTHVPVVVANVAIRSAAPLVDAGLGFNQYWWGSKYWADFVIADWVGPNRADASRPTTLTFFGGNTVAATGMAEERIKLLSTPFSDYEDSLREDLNRVLGGNGFDFDRDATAVYLYRWGHGMIFPLPGLPFGPPQGSGTSAVRTESHRHTLRRQLGRISIAGQDTESTPALESAIGSGQRTADEVLALL